MIDHAVLVEQSMERLRFLRGLLNAVGVECLDTAHGWQLDPTGSGEGPRGKGGHSDPTCTAATSIDRPDPTHRLILSALDSLEDAGRDLERLLGVCELARGSKAHARYRKEYQSRLALAKCGSVLCEDDAAVGERHCDDCSRWLSKHPGVRQVPRDVIAARTRKREQRERGKLHVSGPAREEVA